MWKTVAFMCWRRRVLRVVFWGFPGELSFSNLKNRTQATFPSSADQLPSCLWYGSRSVYGWNTGVAVLNINFNRLSWVTKQESPVRWLARGCCTCKGVHNGSGSKNGEWEVPVLLVLFPLGIIINRDNSLHPLLSVSAVTASSSVTALALVASYTKANLQIALNGWLASQPPIRLTLFYYKHLA